MSHQAIESWDALVVGNSRSAWTVTPTFTRPRSSKIWWGKQSLSCETPNFLQASRKFSTFLRHFAILSLGTAGDGTWILATERGLMWLAKWQRTTPSISAAPMSSGKMTFNLDSRLLRSCRICSRSSRRCSIFLLIVKPGSAAPYSWRDARLKADLGFKPKGPCEKPSVLSYS